MSERHVKLSLSDDEALVFLAWLHRCNQSEATAFEDQAEQRVRAGRDREPTGKSRTSLTAQRQRQVSLQIPKSPSSSARQRHHPGQALCECLTRARLVGTAKAAR